MVGRSVIGTDRESKMVGTRRLIIAADEALVSAATVAAASRRIVPLGRRSIPDRVLSARSNADFLFWAIFRWPASSSSSRVAPPKHFPKRGQFGFSVNALLDR